MSRTIPDSIIYAWTTPSGERRWSRNEPLTRAEVFCYVHKPVADEVHAALVSHIWTEEEAQKDAREADDAYHQAIKHVGEEYQ